MHSDDNTLVGDLDSMSSTKPPETGTSTLARGEELGRYVVLQQLGRGGMGVVYAAFDPQLDRKVALKVLHDGGRTSGSSEGQPRLLREAQALAKLSHPNVVSVHDVGLHGEDVFIAMEFVSGPTLGGWAETPRSWREVVAVLSAAGQGMAAAHRAGIIHRDFKPDNVMLDGEGRPRVLDFGLARAAGEVGEGGAVSESSLELELRTGSLSTKLTQTGALMGTPAYMAPEQYGGVDVDARTDQFAFCVTAYEMLYGERPFAGDSVAAMAFAILQGNVRDAPRETQVPSWLRKVLLRGLATEPEARWPSMDALLEAMGRDPLRRRRWVLAGLAGVVSVAVLGAGLQRGLAAGPQLCSDASGHLDGVWDADARAAVDAAFRGTGQAHVEGTARVVMGELDVYANGWVEMRTQACVATRVRGEQSDEVLSLRMACLDRGLSQLEALAGVYREADAEIVHGAVEALAVLPPLSACADVEGLLSGIRAPDDAQTRKRVAALRARLGSADSLERAGKRSDARESLAQLEAEVVALGYRPLIAEFSLAYGPMLDAPEPHIAQLERAAWMAEASRHDRVAALAWIELTRGYGGLSNDFDAAEMAVQRGDAAIARLAHGGEEEEDLRIRLLVAHAAMLVGKDEREQALPLLREARARRGALAQLSTPAAFEELVTLSNASMALGDHEEAHPLLVAGLAEVEAIYGPGHPWRALLSSTLARVHYMREDYEAAEAVLLDALAIYEQTHGAVSNRASDVLNGLALVRSGAADHAGALEAYARALAISRELTGEDNLRTALIHANMGSLHQRLGRPALALEHLEADLAARRKIFGAESEELFSRREEVALLRLELGEVERASTQLRALLEEVEAHVGVESTELVSVLDGLARVEDARAEPEAAGAWRARAEALRAGG